MEGLEERLQPLRSGAPLVDAEALATLDTDWTKSRAEWLSRRKVFNRRVLRHLLPSHLPRRHRADRH